MIKLGICHPGKQKNLKITARKKNWYYVINWGFTTYLVCRVAMGIRQQERCQTQSQYVRLIE